MFVGVLLAIVGSGLLLGGIIAGLVKRGFVRDASRADGTVVSLLAGGSHPDIEFTTSSGQKISYAQGGWIFGYRPGDRVRVLYDPLNPAGTACLESIGALWFAPLFLSTLGLFFLIGGVLKASFGAAAPS